MCTDHFLFFVLVSSSLGVAAQLDIDQYSAVLTLWAGLNCTAPRCPDFAATAPCPSVLACADGRVTEFIIGNDLKLNGSIDGPALAVLTGLTVLRISNAFLTTLPTQIGRLTSLTYVNLVSSALKGTVPSQIGKLTQLELLGFRDNLLTGTLPALTSLTKLETLSTAENAGLGGNIPELPTSLRRVLFDDCSFTALPPNLAELTGLTDFRAMRNKLAGAPPVFAASVNRTCLVQVTTAETNCIDCPTGGLIGACVCVPKRPSCEPTTTTTTTTAAAATTTGSSSSSSSSSSSISANVTTATAPGTLEPWLIGVIVGGAALAILLVGLVVGCVLRGRRSTKQPATDKQLTPNPQYAAIDVAEPVYDNGRMRVDDVATVTRFY